MSSSTRSTRSTRKKPDGKARAAAARANRRNLTLPESPKDALSAYLREINRYPLLTVDEEQALAKKFRDEGDLEAGHKLVTSNLRFVVKISYEYRSYGLKMADLIQEGNIGLMKAVQKFDPDKKIRLISYGVWWIRAYIQNHILKSWSLVKIGTTQAQRRLFFSLGRVRRELEREGVSDPLEEVEQIAKRLRVKTTEVVQMQQRMDGHDLSLDAPVGDDGGNSHVDFVPSEGQNQQDDLEEAQERHIIQTHVHAALARLDSRERYIIENRMMRDDPRTLKEIGAHFGFSRERARQLELRAREKLRAELAATLPEGIRPEWPQLVK